MQLYPTVYLMAGAPLTWQARYMGATLWDAGNAAISGTSAAFIYQLDRFRSEPIELSTVSGRRAHSLDFRVRRVDDKLLDERVMRRGIPTITPRRLVLELCAMKHRRSEAALDQLRRQKDVELGDLWDLLEKEWPRGRRGIRRYRELVLERTPGTAPTQSELENMFRAFVREYKLPMPINQWRVVLPFMGPVHFDFGYPRRSLAVEMESYGWHLDVKEQFDRDCERYAEAELIGIKVVRVTYSMIKWRRPYLAEILKQHLEPSSGPLKS